MPRNKSHYHASLTTTQVALPHKSHYHTSLTTTRIPLPRKSHYHTSLTTTQVSLPHECHYHASLTTTQVSRPRKSHYHTSSTTTQVSLPHKSHYHTSSTTTQVSLPRKSHYHTSLTTTRVSLPHKSHYHTSLNLHTHLAFTPPPPLFLSPLFPHVSQTSHLEFHPRVDDCDLVVIWRTCFGPGGSMWSARGGRSTAPGSSCRSMRAASHRTCVSWAPSSTVSSSRRRICFRIGSGEYASHSTHFPPYVS